MESIPRLIIVAEHDICKDTQHWFDVLTLCAKHLKFFPNAMLQIRAKTRPGLLELASEKLGVHNQISTNSTIEEYKRNKRNKRNFLHLPQNEAPKKPSAFPFGLSIHHHHDPQKYDQFNPNYYQLGPIYTPISKSGSPKGLSLIEKTVQRTNTPIIAVGGIHPKNVREVLDAGAFGIASSGYIMHAQSPVIAMETLYKLTENNQ